AFELDRRGPIRRRAGAGSLGPTADDVSIRAVEVEQDGLAVAEDVLPGVGWDALRALPRPVERADVAAEGCLLVMIGLRDAEAATTGKAGGSGFVRTRGKRGEQERAHQNRG